MKQFKLKYKNDIFDYISELIDIIEREGFCKGIVIRTKDIQVEQRVKNACKLCDSFNNCYSCPPYSWKIEKTKKIISDYELGIMLVLRIKDIPPRLMKIPFIAFFLQLIFVRKYVRKLHRMVLKLEGIAKKDGYEVQGFIAGPCLLHLTKCGAVDKSGCKLPKIRRSSLESTGINVYRLAKFYGIKIDKKLEDVVHLIGLLLIKKLKEHENVIQITELKLEDEYKIETTSLTDIYEKITVEHIQKEVKKRYGEGNLFIALNKDSSSNEDGIELNKFIDIIEENGYEIINYGYINSLKSRLNLQQVTRDKNKMLLLRIPIIAYLVCIYLKIRLRWEFLFKNKKIAHKVYVLGKKSPSKISLEKLYHKCYNKVVSKIV
ncbi:MAG: DUF2284 domain-containing protein [bacterium]|nr:DUF2284 domain-containing protein [bacterium]